MNGVTPLGDKSGRVPKSQVTHDPSTLPKRTDSAVREAEEAEARAVHAHLRQLVEGSRFEVTDDGERVEGRRIDLRPDLLRKLRHGHFPVDARLDLHGMSVSVARESLGRFLADKRARGERCVLVIHGKGEHSPGGQGALRGEIAAWLSQGASSMHVAGFATAGDRDGGEGAVYVLLARI